MSRSYPNCSSNHKSSINQFSEMLSQCVCGRGSFDQVEDEVLKVWSTPRRSRRICNWWKNNYNNPYSMNGRDKFDNVLADLREKRQKIYQQMGSQDILLVRFSYSSSKDWIPIVLKLRDQKQNKPTKRADIKRQQAGGAAGSHGRTRETKKNKSSVSSLDLFWGRRRNYYYLFMVIVLILVGLAMYGRSFGIICTTLWWYLMPSMMSGDWSLRRRMKKTEHVSRLSETKKRKKMEL